MNTIKIFILNLNKIHKIKKGPFILHSSTQNNKIFNMYFIYIFKCENDKSNINFNTI